MSLATVISAVSTVAAAAVAGWFAWLARRAQSRGPESVAGGYSRLVSDMRVQQEQLAAQIAGLQAQVEGLQAQVDWLVLHVPAEQLVAFRNKFGPNDRPAGPR